MEKKTLNLEDIEKKIFVYKKLEELVRMFIFLTVAAFGAQKTRLGYTLGLQNSRRTQSGASYVANGCRTFLMLNPMFCTKGETIPNIVTVVKGCKSCCGWRSRLGVLKS